MPHSPPLTRRLGLVLCAFGAVQAAAQPSSDPTSLGSARRAPRRAVVESAVAEGEAGPRGLTVPLLLLDDDWTAVPIWGSEATVRRGAGVVRRRLRGARAG